MWSTDFLPEDNCTDGFDNDCNGLIDEKDPNCLPKEQDKIEVPKKLPLDQENKDVDIYPTETGNYRNDDNFESWFFGLFRMFNSLF